MPFGRPLQQHSCFMKSNWHGRAFRIGFRRLNGWLFSLLIAATILLTGCRRTVIGGYTDSPGKEYRVYGKIFGAAGHRFSDYTKKSVRITIVAAGVDEHVLFTNSYEVTGSDVSWDAKWLDKTNVTISIYDYGPGVGHFDSQANVSGTNHLRTLEIWFDPQKDAFVEGSNH